MSTWKICSNVTHSEDWWPTGRWRRHADGLLGTWRPLRSRELNGPRGACVHGGVRCDGPPVACRRPRHRRRRPHYRDTRRLVPRCNDKPLGSSASTNLGLRNCTASRWRPRRSWRPRNRPLPRPRPDSDTNSP